MMKKCSSAFSAVIAICSLFVVLGFSPATLAKNNLPEFTDLIEQASPAVVKINTIEKVRPNVGLPYQRGQQEIPEIFRHLFEERQNPERSVQSMGSGFIVSSDGYILTNNHVVDGADDIQVRLSDRREYEAKIIGTDEKSDLALLKINEKGLPTLKLAVDDTLKVGQWVVAIGSPFGLDFSASAGIVSAIGRSIPNDKNGNYVPFIQTDVAINPGNSGGPLFNLDGEVVGINSQIYTRSGGSIGLSFAIPASVAQQVVNQLKEKGRVDRGWLGVVIQEVDRDLAKSFGLDKPKGALIAQLDPVGPAAKSGLQVGDVIVKFAGQEIVDSADLPHVVGLTAPGEKVRVSVVREGHARDLQVVVGQLGSEMAKAAPAASTGSGDRLGLKVVPIDAELQQQWQLVGGVMVEEVMRGAAEQAGLMPGDVIVQVGFHAVNSADEYQTVVQKLPAKSLLPIRFYRHGRALFRTIFIDQ